MKVSLEQHGFRVEAFPCASEFLAFKHPKVASCLILDIQLPDINGLALQEAMRDRQLIIPIAVSYTHLIKMVKIVLTDDHEMLRVGLKGLLEKEPDFKVVAQAKDGEELLEKLPMVKADCLVIDLSLSLIHI